MKPEGKIVDWLRAPGAAALVLLMVASISVTAQAAQGTLVRGDSQFAATASTTYLDLGGFSDVSGLGTSIEVVEYREGNSTEVKKLPGLHKSTDVTLKRGYTGAVDVQDWAFTADKENLIHRDIAIRTFDHAGKTVRTFNLIDCFPIHWSLDTDDDGYLVESLTVSVGRIELR